MIILFFIFYFFKYVFQENTKVGRLTEAVVQGCSVKKGVLRNFTKLTPFLQNTSESLLLDSLL